MLSAEQAAVYWDSRHRRDGDMRSGGDKSFDEATNNIFYALRLNLLLDVLGHHSGGAAPLFLLDAGCGKGWFSRELAKFGHMVDGIDESETAIAYCRDKRGGPRYFRAPLAQWHNVWLYDAVISIDVLFHIIDDDEWERSVRNITALVRLRGKLVVADWFADEDRAVANYQIVRGRNRYLPLMRECGMRFDSWRPYKFRGSPLGFYVFTRIT
jgi:2-polyprenyl-3-methyl-5-hydroxy-6-metoxy-1,4-benzoquinol methylase